MSENNIIYHDFRPNNVAEEKVQDSNAEDKGIKESDQEMADRLMKAFGPGSILEKAGAFTTTMEKLSEMREYLDSLRPTSVADTMSLRNDLISTMSLEEMSKIINKSSKTDWKKDPSYYQAIAVKFSIANMTGLMQTGTDNQNPEME